MLSITLRILYISLASVSSCKDFVSVHNMICCDVTCDKGEQPACGETEPTVSCETCPHNMYANIPTHPHRRCDLKKICTGTHHMIYINHGSPTTDAVCGCEDGYNYLAHVEKCELVTDKTTPSASLKPKEGESSEGSVNFLDITVCMKLYILLFGSAGALVLLFLCPISVYCFMRKSKSTDTPKRSRPEYNRQKSDASSNQLLDRESNEEGGERLQTTRT